MTDPVGVILAAGLATRMGRPKQLLPYGDGTVLGATVAAATASDLSRVCVVLGAYEAEIRQSVPLENALVVINPAPDRGNLSSLRAAAAAIGEAPLLLMMGDMPGIDVEAINRHLQEWRSDPAWLRLTEYTDGVGHPFMLSPELLAGLGELKGARPLWELGQDDRAETLLFDGPMPIDVDTPDDYTEALARNTVETTE